MSIISTIPALALIALDVYILLYIIKLETIGCDCAMDWRRMYIMFFIAFHVLLMMSMIFLGTSYSSPFLGIVSFVASVLFIVFSLQYVHRLKKEKCECSLSRARDVLEIVAIIDAVLLGIVIFASIMVVVVVFTVADVKKTLKLTRK